MDAGRLVSDDIIIGLVKERLREPDCANGYLFDGFPRTIPQADAMGDAGVASTTCSRSTCPRPTIVMRMSGRRVHPASGRVYHVLFNPPQVARAGTTSPASRSSSATMTARRRCGSASRCTGSRRGPWWSTTPAGRPRAMRARRATTAFPASAA